MFESEVGLDKHLAEVFKDTLERLGRLDYPGLNNPQLEIKSALNPASIMTQDARVYYIVGEGAQTIMLPDTYNGLGFKNLIYMVVEVLDLQERWKAEEDKRAPLHLIFIEEPEAHLHAQLQQVFIRNILDLLVMPGEVGGSFAGQAIITMHSPHILYERGFQPIRYFRHDLVGNDQVTEMLNLSAFYAQETEHRDFLQRDLRLSHCDLFFSDGAVLVEGNVERLLLPMLRRTNPRPKRTKAVKRRGRRSFKRDQFDGRVPRVYSHFAKRPEHRLTWREFEILLFRIFQNQGFTCEIGPGSNDGGIDVRVLQRDPLGTY
ncbi:AAA family ATPase [Aminobacter sp. LjRoot7]|uniref:AAA family ATPase n=1 Tax=Aminobacter sp. LjRoot7 TaxID=3342335 RepID=UPI003ECD6586